MKEFSGLNSQEMEHLIVTIEASLKITKRFQFYLWAQGALQGFIPHETLLCAHGDIARMRFRHETFSRGLFNAQAERDVGDPVTGLLPRIAEAWLRGGCEPGLFRRNCNGEAGWHKLLTDQIHYDFGHLAAHGAREIQGEFGSFFVFVRVPNPPTARDAYLLELLMPYLHMALHRMLANENKGKTADVCAKSLLSRRETEVLHWVKDGKTNDEIGLILNISPPTVKNHVQKILRKLQVSNRAQAVGKAAALRLFAIGDSA